MLLDRWCFSFAGLAFVAALGIAAFSPQPYLVQVVVWTALNLLLAASLRIMLLVGEVNLGVGGFFGVGAYTAALLCVNTGMPTLLAILAGAVVAVLISLPFGFVTLRVSGHYFMLISFALTEILRLVYTRSAALGGNSGIVGIDPGSNAFPVVVIAIVAAGFVALLLAERSHLGRIFQAIAQNDSMVRAVGISVGSVKLLCFVISSAAAGLAGASFAYANTVIAPGDFGFILPVFALAAVKIGGESHPVGVVIGTIILSALSQIMISLGAQDTLLYGAAILFTMLVMPEGVIGMARRLLVERQSPTAQAASTARPSGARP